MKIKGIVYIDVENLVGFSYNPRYGFCGSKFSSSSSLIFIPYSSSSSSSSGFCVVFCDDSNNDDNDNTVDELFSNCVDGGDASVVNKSGEAGEEVVACNFSLQIIFGTT
jgi:hypothetical protein